MSERLTEEEVLDQVCAGEPDQSASDDADTNEIARLAKPTPLQYDRERKVAAENLDVRASILDKLVRAERDKLGIDKDDGKQGHAISFPDPEPWPAPVAGAALLDELAAAVRKHVVLADHARDVCALWIAHTYLVNCFLVSPRLAIRSAVKGCGKTTLLDVFEHLAAKPLRTSSVTASVTFRLIEAHQPSLLIDEADKILNEDRRDLLGILNDGHRRGGRSVRNVPIGDGYEPRAFATFSPLAIALIGSPPAELYDRSVVIDLGCPASRPSSCGSAAPRISKSFPARSRAGAKITPMRSRLPIHRCRPASITARRTTGRHCWRSPTWLVANGPSGRARPQRQAAMPRQTMARGSRSCSVTSAMRLPTRPRCRRPIWSRRWLN